MLNFFKKPLSITSSRTVKNICKHCESLRTVIDCGANIGQFSRAIKNHFPEARIIAIEPQSDAANKFAMNFRNEAGVVLKRIAVSDSSGQVNFFITNKNQQSSINKPILKNDKYFKGGRVCEVRVQACRLDEVITHEDLIKPVMLKLDLQGHEKKALIGARNILDQVDYILAEVSLVKSYEGQSTFDEIYKIIIASGFELKGVMNSKLSGGEIIELDVLFSR